MLLNERSPKIKFSFMNSKQKTCLYGIAAFIGIRIFILFYDFFRTDGHTENLSYAAANPSHNYKISGKTFSWGEEFIYDFSMLVVFSILILVLFMPYIISWVADRKNKNKISYSINVRVFQEKIEKLNRYHTENTISDLNDSLEVNYRNNYLSTLNGWAQRNMKKIITVKNYKPIKIVELNDDEATVISFQNRKEYLEYNGRPMKNQETETIWQHILYRFQKIENDWKIVGLKNKPADNEIIKYLFK
jgi:hypothetical protein